ncbi:hypothetical protein TNCV_4296501 [Trichonephila clavipes]|nr:hypothetical protein TNCV_4296501 [Trichonephila clavipes]
MMEKEPLSPLQGRSYESTRRSLHRLREIPEQGESSDRLAKPSRQWMHRRHSSEGSFIHITGTGTTSEDSLDCGKKCIKGNMFHSFIIQAILGSDNDLSRDSLLTTKQQEDFWRRIS